MKMLVAKRPVDSDLSDESLSEHESRICQAIEHLQDSCVRITRSGIMEHANVSKRMLARHRDLWCDAIAAESPPAKIAESVERLVAANVRVTVSSIAKDSGYSSVTVSKYSNVWISFAKDTEQSIREAASRLVAEGKPISRKCIAEQVGITTRTVTAYRECWSETSPPPVLKPTQVSAMDKLADMLEGDLDELSTSDLQRIFGALKWFSTFCTLPTDVKWFEQSISKVAAQLQQRGFRFFF